MRLIVLALLLALAFGTAQAYPLQGGNENVKATLFGAVKTSLGDQNATQEILRLDASLIGAENATYQLVDSKNNVYQPSLYKSLQPGRQLLFFLVPKDDLFKLITVTPSAGKPFNVNWWATPKGTNGNVIIRYYGITDWLADPDQQALVLQLRIGNNGTSNLPISPENFTLLDQWGWDYYPGLGFEPMTIKPGNATGRVLIGFTGLSPLSKPALLAYDYGTPNQIIIDLEKDQGQLSDAVVYGTNATKTATTAAPAAVQSASQSQNQTAASTGNQTNQSQQNNTTKAKIGSLKDEINASKDRLKGVEGSLSNGQSSTVGARINSSLDETRQRLAMARENLKQNKQNT